MLQALYINKAAIECAAADPIFAQIASDSGASAKAAAAAVKAAVLDSCSSFFGDVEYVAQFLEPFSTGIQLIQVGCHKALARLHAYITDRQQIQCPDVPQQGDNVTLADAYVMLDGFDKMVARVTSEQHGLWLQDTVLQALTMPASRLGITDALLTSNGLANMWEKRRDFMWHDAFIAAVLVHPGMQSKALAMSPGRFLGLGTLSPSLLRACR